MGDYNVLVDGENVGQARTWANPCMIDGEDINPFELDAPELDECTHFKPQWMFPEGTARGSGVGICDTQEEACKVMEEQVLDELKTLFPNKVVEMVRDWSGEEGEEWRSDQGSPPSG